MTITLDDVAQILGVPVEGDCFISTEGGKDIQPTVAVDLASELLGVSLDELKEEIKDSYALEMKWLQTRFAKRAKANSSEGELDKCARVYILYLIGCVIFPDKTKNEISIYYLGALRDLQKVDNFGWGMAILAHTYRQLGHASRSKVKWISGCLTLVVSWICEHFRDCVRAVPNSDYTEAEPRMCRWKPQLLSGDTKTSLKLLREKLDDLSEIDVCWDPYKDNRVERPLHDVSWYCGLLLCFDVAEPYYPDRVLRQFGRVQTIPTMTVIQPLKSTRGKTVQAYKVVYSVNRWQLDNWSDHLLNLNKRSVPVNYPWQCHPKYKKWFLKISHPYIQKRTDRKVHEEDSTARAKLEIGVDKALSMLDGVLSDGNSDLTEIALVARTVRDTLADLRKDTSQVKQREGQEDRTKNRHDSVTAATSSRVGKGKEIVAPQKQATRKEGKGKGPAKKKAKK